MFSMITSISVLKHHIGLFAKNLKDTIHGRVQRRTSQNHPASPQGRSPPLRHASYSNVIKTTPPHTYHWPHDPQTRPQAMPLIKPRLQQQITPTPQQAAPNQTLSHATNARFQQIPPAPHPHPAAPDQCPNAPHKHFRWKNGNVTLEKWKLLVKRRTHPAVKQIQYLRKPYPFYDL